MEKITVEYGNSVGESINAKNSYFDGGLFSLIVCLIAGFLISVCTLGICIPWAVCMIWGWVVEHTVIEGKRLQFNGSAVGLFGNWIKWWLLCIITLGIYGFWVEIAMIKWVVKHTTFKN